MVRDGYVMEGILSDIRVLELGESPSVAFCGKLLADQGATVIKVESLNGDPLRYDPPFLQTSSGELISSSFLSFNTNKFGITLDITQPEAAKICKELVNTCDICIESFEPGYLANLGLDHESLMATNDTLIMLSITYYGQTGPYAHYRADELTSQAIGGFLYAVTGSADKPPMGTVLNQMEITTARNGVVAIMAAVLNRDAQGVGSYIDLSTAESVVATPSQLIHPRSYTGRNPKRGGSDTNVMDGMHLPTKDGEVTLTTAGTGGKPMEVWSEFLDEPRLLDEKFSNRSGRLEHWEELYNLVAPKLMNWENIPLMEATMAQGLVIGLVQSPLQVLQSPHLSERGYFVYIDDPELGNLAYPGPGFFIDGENIMTSDRVAPRLGQHNDYIFTEVLKLSSGVIEDLRSQDAI
ncbi:MAG: CoA transferase [SAR202 cluster bacterium]|jgi:crotonobetainyl-CoA:carnitine CoA-transferase CaiB-like acyl-CoA transferase|nr:CoA transferase [SAR202 cluster bacterium]